MARKFFETIPEGATRRTCQRSHGVGVGARPAVAWLYKADRSGRKNKTSREAVCRECLAGERGNL